MASSFPAFNTLQEYNVEDCCGTEELRQVLRPQLDNVRAGTYNLSLALQAPILSMTLRGVRINTALLGQEKEELKRKIAHYLHLIQFFVFHLTGRPDFNPGSWQQLRWLLYDVLKATPEWTVIKGKKEISTNREALEKMKEKDILLEPFIDLMLLYRDATTLLKFLSYGIDPDGRIRSFFSISGTKTGRLSSSENAFGRGGNLQNITEELRHLFIADPGYVLLNIDLSQADSWNVGMETFQATGDARYLEAILSGDLHTTVSRLVWPSLPWTGDILRDRSIADKPYYRHFSYRDLSKRGGHGANYLSKPKTAARALKVPLSVAEEFQAAYFDPFAAIRDWHQARITELQLNKYIVSILGRKRYFHGRLTDAKTWRDMIGYCGQSPTADIINTITLRIHCLCPQAQLLIQVHDSLLMQIPEHLAETLVPIIQRLFAVPITVTSPSGVARTFTIPADAAVGWNWGKRWKKDKEGNKTEANPDGLDDWKGTLAPRKRLFDPSVSLMDRHIP